MPLSASNTAACTIATTRPAFCDDAPPISETRNASSFQSVTTSARAGAGAPKHAHTPRIHSALVRPVHMVPPPQGNRDPRGRIAFRPPHGPGLVKGGVNATRKGTPQQEIVERGVEWRRFEAARSVTADVGRPAAPDHGTLSC